MAFRKLRLRAESPDDLDVIGAVLQDALIPVADMAYLADESSFALVANRFCWESEAGGAPPGSAAPRRGAPSGQGGHHRVNAGVLFGEVQGVQTRGFDREDTSRILSLLAIRTEAGLDATEITLICAGAASIRLRVAGIDCRLDDIGEPWPTAWRPTHGDAEAD
ncbi:MAG: DUF2948 family protein [Rhodospirillaceae bacterium]|nr:DUF2948 family protein [Rhodospirillaceae bacterium]